MKKRSNGKAALYLIPALLFIGILAFSTYKAVTIYIPQKQAQSSFERLREETLPFDDELGKVHKNRFEKLMKKNPDFRAWLTVEDTVIDYPVMKSSEEDPEFYLRRGFDKQYSRAGCLFVGQGCDITSDAFIIYGHNMSVDTMFGTLDAYADGNYAAKHSVIRLSTADEEREYRVFSAFKTRLLQEGEEGFRYYDSVGTLRKSEYLSTVESLRSASLIDLADAPQYPAQLLLLSTCSYHTNEGRFVVAAYRIK